MSSGSLYEVHFETILKKQNTSPYSRIILVLYRILVHILDSFKINVVLTRVVVVCLVVVYTSKCT